MTDEKDFSAESLETDKATVYQPPIDFRPEVVRRTAVERCTTTVAGRMVGFSVVVSESDALPPGVDIGVVEPAEDETGAHEELVVRKSPMVSPDDQEVSYMGDGQRVLVGSEPGKVREFVQSLQETA